MDYLLKCTQLFAIYILFGLALSFHLKKLCLALKYIFSEIYDWIRVCVDDEEIQNDYLV